MSRLSAAFDSIFGLPKPHADAANPLPTPEERLGLPGAAPAAAAAPAGAKPATPAGAKPAASDGATAAPSEVTDELLLAKARKADCNRTRDMAVLGKLAHRRAMDESDRAATLRYIRQLYLDAGLTGDAANVRKQIYCFGLAECFGGERITALPASTAQELFRLVCWERRTGVWGIRMGLEAGAHDLLANACGQQWKTMQVREAVTALLGPPRARRHKKSPPRQVAKLRRQIERLWSTSPEEFAELYDWLQALRTAKAA